MGTREVRDIFIKRPPEIISAVRRYLDGQGFMVLRPRCWLQMLVELQQDLLRTTLNALNEDLKLRISLELYLKRLIVGGLERVYEMDVYSVTKVLTRDTIQNSL